MEILNHLYTIIGKNKHIVPASLLLLLSMLIKSERVNDSQAEIEYLGDNLPLNLIEELKKTTMEIRQ